MIRCSSLSLAEEEGLIGLGNLTLAGTQIDDAGLAPLKGVTRLGMLDLDFTAVSDAGLAHLKGLTRLQWLHITGTQISHDGGQERQQALPKTDILRGHLDSVVLDPAPPEPRTGRRIR